MCTDGSTWDSATLYLATKWRAIVSGQNSIRSDPAFGRAVLPGTSDRGTNRPFSQSDSEGFLEGAAWRYIQFAMLNGKPLEKPWIYRSDMAQGATLAPKMGLEPDANSGSSPKDAPLQFE